MLQRNGEDIASKSVFNEANLKEHLRGKTADELIEELEKLYDEEELTGEEFDPRIVEIYIEAMEKVSPPDPAAERAFDRSWALFHTKHRVEKEPSSSHSKNSMAYRSCRAYSYFLMRIRCSIWLEGLYYYMER